ncbi:hypothetical protein [Corynebacterium auris]|uniref:hypothetical protein n=1 Tax=Corynebacterium auris TaxID=44750 RepID=UPI0025B330F1|nr:hypothetical protein [Corynebacterium auris]
MSDPFFDPDEYDAASGLVAGQVPWLGIAFAASILIVGLSAVGGYIYINRREQDARRGVVFRDPRGAQAGDPFDFGDETTQFAAVGAHHRDLS